MFTFFYCAIAMETVRVLWCHNSHTHENFDDVGKWRFIYHLKDNSILIYIHLKTIYWKSVVSEISEYKDFWNQGVRAW